MVNKAGHEGAGSDQDLAHRPATGERDWKARAGLTGRKELKLERWSREERGVALLGGAGF